MMLFLRVCVWVDLSAYNCWRNVLQEKQRFFPSLSLCCHLFWPVIMKVKETTLYFLKYQKKKFFFVSLHRSFRTSVLWLISTRFCLIYNKEKIRLFQLAVSSFIYRNKFFWLSFLLIKSKIFSLSLYLTKLICVWIILFEICLTYT